MMIWQNQPIVSNCTTYIIFSCSWSTPEKAALHPHTLRKFRRYNKACLGTPYRNNSNVLSTPSTGRCCSTCLTFLWVWARVAHEAKVHVGRFTLLYHQNFMRVQFTLFSKWDTTGDLLGNCYLVWNCLVQGVSKLDASGHHVRIQIET